MKRKMSKTLLLIALICVLTAGTAVTAFADTAGATTVTGDGSWYYVITVAEETSTDNDSPVEFWVEMCDENGDWLTTTSFATAWVSDDDGSLSYSWMAINGEEQYGVSAGFEVVVAITRSGGDIEITYYVNNAEYYSMGIYGTSFTDTVTWQVNLKECSATVSELIEKDQGVITDIAVKSLTTDEFAVGSCFDLSGTVLAITYADGHTEDLTLTQDREIPDAYGNRIFLYALMEGNDNVEIEDSAEINDSTEINGNVEINDSAEINGNVEINDSAEINGNAEINDTIVTANVSDDIYDGEDIDTSDDVFSIYVSHMDIFETTGEYTLIFEAGCYDYFENDGNGSYEDYVADGAITVRDATTGDAASTAALTLNEKLNMSSDDQWFSFTPSKTGYYTFRTQGDDVTDTYLAFYEETEGGVLSLCKCGWLYTIGDAFHCYLKEGTTYYFRVGDYGGFYSPYEAELIEGKGVASIEVESLGQTEFVQYIDCLDLMGSVLSVTYTDGTTETIVITGDETYDAYGNCFFYVLKYYDEESGEFYEGDIYDFRYGIDLAVGAYTVPFVSYYTGYSADSENLYHRNETQSITVVTLADSSETIVEIDSSDQPYSAEIESGGQVWFAFTPSEDGIYYFAENWATDASADDDMIWNNCYLASPVIYNENEEPDYPGVYWDEDDNVWYYDEETDTWYYMYELEAGQTYYLRASFEIYHYDTMDYESGATATVTVTAKRIESTSSGNQDDTPASADGDSENPATSADGDSVDQTNTADDEKDVMDSADSTGNTGDTNSTGDTDSTAGQAPATGDVQVWVYCVMLIGAAVMGISVKKRVNLNK